MNFALLLRVLKLRRRGFLYLQPATHAVRLDCLQGDCPNSCCKYVGPPQISVEEGKLIGGEYIEDGGVGLSLKEGPCGCCRLGQDGLCQSYQQRPQACSDYPWYNVSGKLYYDSGCPGIKFDRDDRPALDSIRPFEWYLVGMGRLMRKLVGFFVCH